MRVPSKTLAMPLLRKKPFNRIKTPSDLKSDEEVFHCTLTNEIFRNYDQFYERIILCNSLVWSCALTGKPNLTYAEAKESEKVARDLIQSYAKELHIPTLYIASLAQRTSFLEVLEDVWSFTKDRYFINEKVDAHQSGVVVTCVVTKVIAPSNEVTSPSKSTPKSKGMSGLLDPSLYQYEIMAVDEEDFAGKKIVKSSEIKRPKSHFSREKQRLFLRNSTESGPGGIIRLKEYCVRKYKMSSVNFSTIFAGPEPNFQQSKKALKALGQLGQQQLTEAEKEQRRRDIRNQRRKEKRMKLKEEKMLAEQQSTPRKRNSEPLKSSNMASHKSPKSASKASPSKGKNVKKLTAEQIKELKIEKARQQKEADRLRKIEERNRARAKAKEDKRRLDDFHKEWSKVREDLLCEDLKELPEPCMVQCRIPNHLIGDFVAVLEFLANFKDVLRITDFFPKGVSFEILERALVEQEVAGPMIDLLQMLLSQIFLMQEEEEAEVKTSDTEAKVDLAIGGTEGSVTLEEAIREATRAASWSQSFQGLSLGKLNLDFTSLSEILRLHLYSSGGRSNEANSAWRYQQRGGYTVYDDPGLMLRMTDPQILRALKHKTVIELSIEEKLKIITCLMHQFLMFASIRDLIFERAEKLRKVKGELRILHLAEKKREMEETIWQRQHDKRNKEGEAPAEGEKAPPPMSAEEAEAEKAKRDKDSARKRADFITKEHKLQAEVNTLSWGVSATPLGCDRAYRRYWLFQSLPGLFIEHDDEFVGNCLKSGTPTSRVQICEDPLDYVRHLFVLEQSGGRGGSEEASSSSSDKENERSPVSKQKSHPPSQPVRSNDNEEEEERVTGKRFICTGEQDSCVVHSTVLPRVNWSFLNRPDELDRLLASLNSRGVREGELKQTLSTLRPHIEGSMAKCPAHILGRPEDEEKVEVADAMRRSARQTTQAKNLQDANLNYAPGTPMPTILENVLREMVLELEEKIQMGGLGSLKVTSREAWRESLERDEYDSQCESLTWSGNHHHHFEGPTDKFLSKLKTEAASRPDTPDSVESGPIFGGESGEEGESRVAVFTLACALLQLEQAMEARYLKEPLGESEKDRQKRQKKLLANDGEEPEEEKEKKKPTKTQLERWEQSLMASTSFSQLFVHYGTLETSVTWSKSALNAKCRVCRRKGDAEKMLLCDGCNKGTHTYCLKPELKHVPMGEWFCQACRPKEVPPTPRKSRKNFTEESEEEDTDEEEEEEDEDQEENSDDEENEDEEVETCAVCTESGNLVTCEDCRNCYHPGCAKPKLRAVPRSAWTCQDCRDAANKPKGGSKKHGAVVLAQKSIGSRRCAREASNKITKAAKRLRSNSWDDTDESRNASGTDEPNRSSSGRVRRRPRWLALDCEDPDLPLNASLLHVLLSDVMNHSDAWPFLRPVQKSEAPDYHQIIKRPMDFGNIKYKLNMMEYRNNSEFLADALLIFENCEMYNQPSADEYKAGHKLHKFFERKCQDLGLRIHEEDLESPDNKRARRPI